MYEIYGSATDATLCRVQAAADFSFPFAGLLAAINARTKLIAIANPNSPTGSVATREQIVTLAQAAPHAIVLVDEAYFHFYGETIIGLIAAILSAIFLISSLPATFSQSVWSCRAARVGLLAGSETILRWVRRVLSPYSVNSIALACLAAALDDTQYLDWYVGEVKQARSEFLDGLYRLGLPYWPTEANFVLVNIGSTHRQFVTAMRDQDILVRDRSADPGCEGCVRITIGTPEQMRSALIAIESFLKVEPAGASR